MRKRLYDSAPDVDGRVLVALGVFLLLPMPVCTYFFVVALAADSRADGRSANLLILVPRGLPIFIGLWLVRSGILRTRLSRVVGDAEAEILGVAQAGHTFALSFSLPVRRRCRTGMTTVRLIRQEWATAQNNRPGYDGVRETVIARYDAGPPRLGRGDLFHLIVHLTLPSEEPPRLLPRDVPSGCHYQIEVRVPIKDGPTIQEDYQIRDPYRV
jgi:hypothetical protein